MMQFSPEILFNQKHFSTDDLAKLSKIHKKKVMLSREINTLETEIKQITDNMKQHGCVIDGRIEDPKTRNLRIGKKKFNFNPEEGIQYLIQKNVIIESPIAVAKFLSDQSLNKKAVGDYIGNISNPFNCDVMDQFINRYDFGGLEFVDAIRLFLSGFHLPGESQKIDKIVMAWSSKFLEQNPGVFKNQTETYVMTYAVIMLNTCLHNPTAKKINGGFGKEEDFLKIMRDFDSEFDILFIKRIFKSIKDEPLSCMHKTKDESLAYKLENVEISGWLWKLGGRVKSWKKRWFVLADQNLLYFLHPESSNMKGMIPLQNVFIRDGSRERKFQYCFEICASDASKVKGCKSDNSGKTMLGNHHSYRIACGTQIELQNWKEAIQRSINTIWQLELLRDIE